MKPRSLPIPRADSYAAAGGARPSSPVSVFGEDFSLVVRKPKRLRIVRGRITVLS